ncbi:FAD-dependent oxidoreductase [Hydrogenophaga sp. SL48]|uniref:FAD-dependent oxidoreductase n=1 Tax=Hydrogenophaga sp. SL48 TaxID=2806347 RepID=UPI001F374D5D|nr:FAD-dependent oxidoreductase [Hydrogenophaga sp. SL48]UJW79153.1 FAD-dependent oxidoreductase [Hydrogenophaga sp. SL48]
MHHGIKKLLLLGAGPAHLQVLARLAQNRPADLDVTVLTPYPHHTHSGMTTGLMVGRYSAKDCQIPLEPLVKAAGARCVQGRCAALDAAGQTVLVGPTGKDLAPSELTYHLLSIDTGAVFDRTRLEADMPGASTHALMVRPVEVFATLWPQVMERAVNRPLSIAVVGAGAAGLELLFAAEQCLRLHGAAGARFTLITGGTEPAEDQPRGVQRRVLRRLKALGITVLRDTCVGMDHGVVRLGGGAELACDLPLLAIGTHAPAWLTGSGLALCEAGHVLVNEHQQSTSHPNVFAAGDVATRADAPHPRHGVHAVRAGPTLATNLLAAHEGSALTPHHPPKHTLNLLSCGAGHAIASWGPLHAEGAWAWAWKDRIDRAFVAAHTRHATPAAAR